MSPVNRQGAIAATQGFLETMDQFLAVQERVMRRYLRADAGDGGHSGPPSNGEGPRTTADTAQPPPPTVASRPPGGEFVRFSLTDEAEASGPQSAVGPVAESGSMAATAGPNREQQGVHSLAVAIDGSEGLARLLLEIVSERTGYPVEVIASDADLEADLGIDSIKRVEILGTLRQRMEGIVEIDLEALTAQRTLDGVIDVVLQVTK
jgi:acyl carrier protein